MKYVLPYKMGSQSAKVLAQALGVLRIKGHKILPRDTTLINWGRGEFNARVRGGHYTILNKPQAVAVAKNKITALQTMRAAGISVPDFTTDINVARGWRDEETVIYGRSLVSSQEGRGIVIITAEDAMAHCPLYTKGIHKAHEYRVHVFKGRVIDFTKKKRREGSQDDGRIKNAAHGWVFCRDNVHLPNVVQEQAVRAVAALGLDFAAVDVLYRERENVAWVLEANTAPGIEGTTLNKYVEAIRGA